MQIAVRSSYFVNGDATDTDPQIIMLGDENIGVFNTRWPRWRLTGELVHHESRHCPGSPRTTTLATNLRGLGIQVLPLAAECQCSWATLPLPASAQRCFCLDAG